MPIFLPSSPAMTSDELDLNVYARRQVVEPLERVDRLRRGLKDVDQPLVRTNFEVLARVLVLEGPADHAVDVLLRGQGHGPGYRGSGAGGRLDDLLGGRLDRRVVVGLEPDADLVLRECRHWLCEQTSGAGADWPPAPEKFVSRVLLDDGGDHPRADRAAALADREAQALVHCDGLDELHGHLDVVTRHDHLRALGQGGNSGHVGRAEVELRPVAVEERGVTATLLLLQHVDRRGELGVRGDRARLAENLPALDVLTADTTQQAAHVVARLTLVEDLAEHLDSGHDRVLGVRVDTDDLDRVARVHDALLDAAGRYGAAAGDREDVLDRHQEGAVERTLGLGDVRVQRLRQLDDLVHVLLVALERLQCRALDHGHVVAREVVLGQELADLDLDELEELLVVDHVHLVHEHDHVGHVHLTREQDVLAGLRHRAVGRRYHEDRPVHLGCTRDHVLDVIGVTGAIDVRVVTVLRLVLHVRGGDRDAALLLLRSVVDLLEAARLAAVLLGQHLSNGRGQRRLAVVDVPDRADIHMRLIALELLLRHSELPLSQSLLGPRPELAKHTL